MQKSRRLAQLKQSQQIGSAGRRRGHRRGHRGRRLSVAFEINVVVLCLHLMFVSIGIRQRQRDDGDQKKKKKATRFDFV